METYQKPIIGVRMAKCPGDKSLYEVDGSQYKGLFFETPERAVTVLANMCDYQHFISE